MKKIIISLVVSMGLAVTAFAQNTVSTPPASARAKERASIKSRLNRQEARIHQGVKSGELTPQEAKNLQKSEARIARKAEKDKLDGGGLTPKERMKTQKRLEKQSARIYQKKHNGKTQ